MYDVVIAGAGPAGAVAATVLARAGARVALIDRSTFPRHKFCGDTLNPGVLAILRRLGLSSPAESCGLPIDGMMLTGEDGSIVAGRYPTGLMARAITRRDLDWPLVHAAIAAGTDFFDATTVLAPIVATGDRDRRVGGVQVRSAGQPRAIRGRVTIASDGRRSRLAFGLGLLRHPPKPRRWAIGAYLEGVAGMSAYGEMHVRPGHYIGVAPLPHGLTNVCLVKPSGGNDPELRTPLEALTRALASDRVLHDRFARARFISAPSVMGPLAVDVSARHVPDGLLLAGDAAGFVDPMTGDGLRFAIRGGEMAAEAALEALEHGWRGIGHQLAAKRDAEFSSKIRFNRTLRAVVGSTMAVKFATAGAPYLQSILRRLIRRAGDCDLCHEERTPPLQGPTSHR